MSVLCVFCMPLRVICRHAVIANMRGNSPEEVAALLMAQPGLQGLQGPTISPVYGPGVCGGGRAVFMCTRAAPGGLWHPLSREKGVENTAAIVLRSSCAWLRSGSLTETCLCPFRALQLTAARPRPMASTRASSV